MRFKHFVAATALATLAAVPALAQTVSFGTTQTGGTNNNMSQALSKVVSGKHGLKMRIVPMTSLEGFGPVIDAGRMEIAFSAATDISWAYNGEVTFKKKALKNLRMIAGLYKFPMALLVRKDSPIKKIGDLKGKKVPTKFNKQFSAGRHIKAAFWSAGLTEADFDGVPVPNVVRAAKDFAQGKIVATWFKVGAGKVKEMAVRVGGIRYLPAETSPEAIKRMRKYTPGATIQIMQPNPAMPGIRGPTPVITEIYHLLGGKHVSDDVVAKILDTLYTEQKKLIAVMRLWKDYDPKKMWKEVAGVPDHPGAVKWYKSKGLKRVK